MRPFFKLEILIRSNYEYYENTCRILKCLIKAVLETITTLFKNGFSTENK